VTRDSQKKVDESWKESVHKERTSPEVGTSEEAAPPGSGFLGFVSTLAMQASSMMEEEQGLPQARYLIDILQLLSEKTKGNLTPEEELELKNILYGLRVLFVKKSQGASS